MIFAKSAIAQLALLLSASSSSSVVVVGASKTPTETNDYEPNGRLVHKPIMPHNVATKRINRRHHDNNNKAHHSLRKLKSSASNGTGGSKSSKSAQPPEEGGDGSEILGYLDPIYPQGCPCFTTADIDQAWDVLTTQDPEAECLYQEFYENMELSSVNIDAYANSAITNLGFGMIVTEVGPKFHDPNETPCCGYISFVTGECVPIDDEPCGYDTYGTCSASRHSNELLDENDSTVYGSIYQRFDADTAKDCFEEIMNSNMITKCTKYTNGVLEN